MKKKYSTSWKINFLLFVLSLAAIFLVLEIAIRTYDMVNGDGFFSGHRNLITNRFKKVRPFRTFGLKLYRNVNGDRSISSRNRDIFPIKKANGTFRIVAFGGSTTANKKAFKKKKIHYPLVLQSKLRKSLGTKKIEVINLGNAAYATPHSLILFELDVLSWEPDMIIVSHNINDLLAAYWPEFTYDYSNKYSNEYYLPSYKTIYTTSNTLFQHSQLYWFIRQRINNTVGKGNREIRRRSYGKEPPKLLTEVYARNLRSFIAIAKNNGIEVLLGSQPLQSSEEYFIRHMGHKPYNSIITYPLHDEFVHHHRIINDTMRRVAKETDVFFLDNESSLGDNKKYFFDFVHYTPTGVRALANNYAEFILKENIIQLSETI